jgi:hypothetical protein
VAYDTLAYKVRYIADDTTSGLPGGTVTLSLPDVDVPPVPLVLLIDAVTVQCPGGGASSASLYDADPTQVSIPPMATTQNPDLDQGESANGLVIPGGANLYIQWVGVAPGALCSARVQFRLAQPVTTPGTAPQAHPILGG